MKTLLTLGWLVLMFQASSQSFTPQVINIAGSQSTVNEYSMHWSVGETTTQPLRSGDYILTQGFQQPLLGKATSYQDPEFLSEVRWHPNPVATKLFLATGSIEMITVEFGDLQGRVLKRITFSQQSAIDIPPWPTGPYLMRWTLNGRPIYHAIWIKN